MELQGDTRHQSLLGTELGSFVVRRLLGEGGMGSVYELFHPGIKKRLAVKVLHADYAERPDVVQRFFDEARAVNVINHPNIVDIIDFQTLPDGRPYLTMEFLEGRTLSERIADSTPFEFSEIEYIVSAIGSALAAAHRAGIVHRDLKPDNIFIQSDGGVKVLDFGVAKLQKSLKNSSTDSTRTGAVLGTPLYMSPEQASGKPKNIDPRSDVYALGVITFQMLTRALPFEGKTFAELILKHLNHPAPAVSSLRPEIDPAWDTLVQRALEKDKEKRHATMDDFVGELKSIGGASSSKRFRRGKIFFTLFAVGVIIFALAFVLVRWRPGSSPVPANSTVHTQVPSTHPDASGSLADAPRQDGAQRDAALAPLSVDGGGTAELGAENPGVHRRAARKARRKGALVVRARPWAIVTVDGKARGQTPLELHLSEGVHRLRAVNKLEGTVRSKSVKIKPGDTNSVTFDMAK